MFYLEQQIKILRLLYIKGVRSVEDLIKLKEKKMINEFQLSEKEIHLVLELQEDEIKYRNYEKFFISEEKTHPKRMIKFFSDYNLNADNILQTSLSKLISERGKLSVGKIEAFLEFKNQCFRLKYNNTLDDNSKLEVIEKNVVENFLRVLKKYVSNKHYEKLFQILFREVTEIGFENVDFEKHQSDIFNYLDIDYFFSYFSDEDREEILIQVLKKERRDLNLFSLKKILSEIIVFDLNKHMFYLEQLSKYGFVKYMPTGIRFNTPTIDDFIKNNVEKFSIINNRLNGLTLEEIGIMQGVTRERIRQKEVKELKKIPLENLYESRYMKYYQKYNLTERDFCNVFLLNNYQYRLFYLYIKRVPDKELLDPEELLNNDLLTYKEKERLYEIVNRNFIIIGNHRIRKTKIDVVKYCVEKFAQKEVTIKEFHVVVQKFVKSILVDIDFSSERALEGAVSRCENCIWSWGRKFRYFQTDQEDILKIFNEIEFNRYMNQEISAKKIYLDYKEELVNNDIQNEYELHNLLKKNSYLFSDVIIFKRMPFIEIGVASREEQVLDLLIELSPITVDSFVEEYTLRFGVIQQTIKANFMPFVNEFRIGELLNADTPAISRNVITNLSSILVMDFYFKEDIYNLYRINFSEEKLPEYIYSQIGYRNFSEFILNDAYKRADIYFEEKYFAKEIFEISDSRLLTLGSFRHSLERLQNNLDTFEYAPKSFIRFSKINEYAGIEKQDFKYLIEKIKNNIGDKYFTIDTIQSLIENSPIYQLGFEDIFYESLLKRTVGLRFQQIGNKVVFKNTKEKFYTYNLIEELVLRYKSIDIYDLLELLEKDYGIQLTKEKIISSCEKADLYYQPIMEMIYVDIENFYEMMEEE